MRGQPPLAAYVLGFGLLVQGRDLDTNGFWNMDREDAWNNARGNRPSHADLIAARRTSAAIGALTVAVVYLLSRRLTNRVGAIAAALALAFHPLLIDTSTRAWSDPVLVLMVALAALAAFWLGSRNTWPRALLLGACLGLGGAAKLSPLLVPIPLAALGGWVWLTQRRAVSRGDGRRLVRQLMALPGIAFAVLVASYPYLWPNPVQHTYNLFVFRVDSFASQGRSWPHAAVDSRWEALQRVGTQLSERFSVGGRLAVNIESRTGFELGSWARNVDLALAVIGAVVLLILAARRGVRSGHALAIAVLAAHVAITVLAMGVDYPRYHLPILLAVVVCIGAAVGQGWALIARVAERPGWSLQGAAPRGVINET